MNKRLLIMTTVCALSLLMSACGNSKEADSSTESSEVIETSVLTEGIATETIGTFTFDVPEGFIETDDNFYAPEDPDKASSINYITQENDGSFDTVNAETLMQTSKSQLESMYEIDVNYTLLEEEFYEIDGYRAFKYSLEYTLVDVKFVQTQIIVEDPENLHFITFTEVNDEGYLDAFKAAADSIRFE